MRKDIDNIEIKEPPIEELKKNRSCLKRSCATGCGCVIILIIVFLLLLKFVAVPRPKELKVLPADFPESIPVYDQDNAEYITFLSGKRRSGLLEAAAYIPKVALVPIFISAENYAPEEIRMLLKERESDNFWQKFTFLMKQPIAKSRDTFEIKWLDLSAEPDFVKEYYETKLRQAGYETELAGETGGTKQLIFEKDNVQGTLFIKDNPEQDGTDIAILTVTLPEE